MASLLITDDARLQYVPPTQVISHNVVDANKDALSTTSTTTPTTTTTDDEKRQIQEILTTGLCRMDALNVFYNRHKDVILSHQHQQQSSEAQQQQAQQVQLQTNYFNASSFASECLDFIRSCNGRHHDVMSDFDGIIPFVLRKWGFVPFSLPFNYSRNLPLLRYLESRKPFDQSLSSSLFVSNVVKNMFVYNANHVWIEPLSVVDGRRSEHGIVVPIHHTLEKDKRNMESYIAASIITSMITTMTTSMISSQNITDTHAYFLHLKALDFEKRSHPDVQNATDCLHNVANVEKAAALLAVFLKDVQSLSINNNGNDNNNKSHQFTHRLYNNRDDDEKL